MQFYPNFALFLNIGGMNFDYDFFLVSKLSEDQKKGLYQKWNTFFPDSGEDPPPPKKRYSQKWNTFFLRYQVETCAQMHTRVKLLEGMHIKTILKLLGGDTVKLLRGYIPHRPGFRHPWLKYIILCQAKTAKCGKF